jgi:hypothetical protein
MNQTISFRVKGLSVPKEGELQNEDSWDYSETTGRIAVADGVSAASYSAEWARVLVRGFVEGGLDIPRQREAFVAEIEELQEGWHQLVPWELLEKKGYPFNWKARQGGFSTFLGLSISNGHWSAFAVGDCNMFVVTYLGEVKASWPMTRADDFGDTPAAIRSIRTADPNDRYSPYNVYDSILKSEGALIATDCLVLCTDALAMYLLNHLNNRDLWFDLLSMDGTTAEDFSSWTRDLRRMGLRNDDLTAVVIESF